MKKLLTFLSVITLLIICTCVGEKVHLGLKPKPGESFTSRITIKQKISQVIQQQSAEIDQTMITDYTYDVLEVTKAGNAKIKITYDEIAFIQDGPLGRIEFKSWEKTDTIPLVAKGLASLVEQSFTMEISQQGRVIQISGVDEIINNMIKDLDVIADDEVSKQIKVNIKNQFGNEAIKETMEKMFAIYPDKPVGIGDSWTATFTINRGLPMILNNTWKLKNIRDGKVHIDVHSKIEPNAEVSFMQMSGMKMAYELTGQQKGYIVIDTTTGWVINSEVEQSLEGKINISGELLGASEKMEVPVTVSSTINTESGLD